MEKGEPQKLVDRANLIIIAAGINVWLTPMFLFWGAAFGPLKPFGYPNIDTAPYLSGFLFWLAVSFLPCVLPRSCYRPGAVAPARRRYGSLGVRVFKQIAPNGELVNRLVRRRYPGYRVVGRRTDLPRFLEGTRNGERSHLVLLLMGLFTAVYAARIGWYRWAIFLTLGNGLFNLYPVMLSGTTAPASGSSPTRRSPHDEP
jgi:hypothetical protein